jgi:hypothetical protein
LLALLTAEFLLKILRVTRQAIRQCDVSIAPASAADSERPYGP